MSGIRSKKPYSRPAARPQGSEGEWLHDKAPGARVARNASTAASGGSETPNSKLLISNLHYELTPQDLTQIFGVVGPLGTKLRLPRIHLRDTDPDRFASVFNACFAMVKYDRSGRSSGIAVVSYESAQEATAARSRFEGKLAKGQPMTIEFYNAPQHPRRVAAGAPSSLLHRIQKPPLLDRLSGNGPTQPQKKAVSAKTGPGPIRTRGPRAARVPKKPKTAEELDMEIESFMKDDGKAAPPVLAAPADGDVEMV